MSQRMSAHGRFRFSFLRFARCWVFVGLAAAVAVENCGGVGGEVFKDLPSGGMVGLSTRGPSALRVRVFTPFERCRSPIETPMVSPRLPDAPFHEQLVNGGKGIKTAFGSVLVSSQGELTLLSASGAELTKSLPIGLGTDGFPYISFSSNEGRLYGRGASLLDAHQLATKAAAVAQVCNTATYTPYYYSTDGYAALGITSETKGQYLAVETGCEGERVRWQFHGAFELYLMPAASLSLGTTAYFQLTGFPRVPPRYAFGFLASRWGWDDLACTLQAFRTGSFPIDAFIVDFEWFTNVSDYSFLPQGERWYRDFDFNPKLISNPMQQLSNYKSGLKLRMAGIRKPRLGNTASLEFARSKGWILPNGEPGGGYPSVGMYAYDRCLNFSKPDVRKWYGERELSHLTAGVDFWWNDEGETDYYTYYWWNVAQLEALRRRSPSKRFYTLNRAFTPGMARLGATVWTGDINATWNHLSLTPGMMLNWGLGGAPYVGCDIGGFSGETEAALLTRWYQMGAFMPTMRVHSKLDATPHWPWLFGATYAATMRKALELRYALLPYHYSLAHKLFVEGVLWIQPLVMLFPNDTTAAEITSEWMDGEILVAPILRQDSQKQVYLPEGLWYDRGTFMVTRGPANIVGEAALDDVPTYVRPGTVIPLAPGVQYSDALPGGPLQVEVYAGTNGVFELIEDDGETTAYEEGNVRTTRLTWEDSSRTLSWVSQGTSPGPHAFAEVFGVMFDSVAAREERSSVVPLGTAGVIRFGVTGTRFT